MLRTCIFVFVDLYKYVYENIYVLTTCHARVIANSDCNVAESIVMNTDESTSATEDHTAATTTADDSTAAANRISYPDCWSIEQYKQFMKDNNWLYCNEGRLGCSVCREVSSINATLKVPVEWVECKISPYGKSRAAEQTSLRKKMHDHRTSQCHKTAFKLLQVREEDILKSTVANQLQQSHTETANIFRTAYYIAHSDRPYTDHAELIKLQALNGVNVGRVLHSNVTCTDIVNHISCEMRSALISSMIVAKSSCSVLIDESTSLGRASCLVVYLRTTFDDSTGPVTFFLDIIELSSTTAEGIEKALLDCLHGHGLTVDYLQAHWVGFGCDGASVMMGIKSGVAARLRSKFPQVICWHCLNHRLELSVGDAVKSCTEINNFKAFMDLLYSTYSMSPKLNRELGECASELQMLLNRIGRILDVRWVASSCRTVKAVWHSYEALHSHFSNKVLDKTLDTKEKAKFNGMIKKMENPTFIKNLGLMFDALDELADLSLALQKSDITLPVANKLITRQVQVFSARRECDSEYYSEACLAVEAGMFRGVKVGSAGKEKEINKCQFYQALADCMSARLLPESEKQLCKAIEAIDASSVAGDSRELEPEFGESQVKLLCVRFGIPFSAVKNAYRDWKDSKGVVVNEQLRQLTNTIDTIPVSTAACERGFSKMNVVCSPLRSRLTLKNMSSLMFISLSGPPLQLWDPSRYVKSWLLANRREATCTQGPSAKKDGKSLGSPHEISLWNAIQLH